MILAPLLSLVCTLVIGAAEARVQRFSIAVGANDGGRSRMALQFAESDAVAWSAVMMELGGLTQHQVLAQPTLQQLQAAFAKVRQQIATSRVTGHDTEFLFYYSGHADGEGLALGGESYAYHALLAAAAFVAADVQVLVVDACAAGALGRRKGGQVAASRPALAMGLPVRGHAFLMSASAHEAAQESDSIGGSYFTHYLLAGLRGAADTDADGVISLDEAYRFAAHETLLRTIRTMGGPQHPTYDFDLTGEQTLALTDLRRADSTLQLPTALRGHVFVYDSHGHLRADLHKEHDPVNLALPADDYALFISNGDALWTSEVTLRPQHSTLYDVNQASSVSREVALGRGAVAAATADDLPAIELAKTGYLLRLGLGLGFTRVAAFTTGDTFTAVMPTFDIGPTDDDLALTLHLFATLHAGRTMGPPPGDVSFFGGPSFLFWPTRRLFAGIGAGLSGLIIPHSGVPAWVNGLGQSVRSGLYLGAGMTARFGVVAWHGARQDCVVELLLAPAYYPYLGGTFSAALNIALDRRL